MQPESSDGFASVGTILPKEEAALLPGGLFVSAGHSAMTKIHRNCHTRVMKKWNSVDTRGMGPTAQNNRREETPMHDMIMALAFIAMVMAPCVVALTSNPDRPGSN
jgi:hypothetical protein